MTATFASGVGVMVVGLTVAIVLGGCAATPRGQGAATDRSAVVISNTDPCATQMHDLSGLLLLYYAVNRSVPPSLADLSSVAAEGQVVTFTCPVTGRPYVYMPDGPINPGSSDRLMVFDPSPAHAGFRWAIAVVEPPQPGGALVVKVVAVREDVVKWPRVREPME